MGLIRSWVPRGRGGRQLHFLPSGGWRSGVIMVRKEQGAGFAGCRNPDLWQGMGCPSPFTGTLCSAKTAGPFL